MSQQCKSKSPENLTGNISSKNGWNRSFNHANTTHEKIGAFKES
jgi:hypothetical protein